ncbi:hypothetical protein F5Y16DRAFT_55013 [Xylariaceae sp. FL0255]|nr:hypothetical protein F5Y16DRAFT_55013 [Xylariaceae sp. FL0255]
MMADFVEGRSLAALNQLAGNPPLYPKKPTEARQDALTLYISRVPGTRDIILSTLKPQVKNVTAEDVASSLYYVHFQTPEDEPPEPPNQPLYSPASPETSGESPRTLIHRKPLPRNPEPPLLREEHSHLAAHSGKENQGFDMSMRKPGPVANTDIMSENRGLASSVEVPPPVPIHRKPLGPRPSQPAGEESSLSRSLDDRPPLPYEMSGMGREIGPPLPARPPVLPPRPLEINPQDSAFSSVPKSKKRRPFTPFSLTMIRRDPSTGQQWNVGKIASFQLENPELIDEGKHSQPSPSIQIHLESSGYAKFRGMPTEAGLGIRGSLDSRRPGSSSSMSRGHFPDMHMNKPASGAFERQVRMTYSPSFTANLRQRLRSRSLNGEPPPSINRPSHDRQGSITSIGSFGGDFDGSDAPVITQPAPGLKPRGYMFYSPWDGRCEFITGNAGRSLKCRHVLPSYNNGMINPLVGSQDAEHGDEKVEHQAISELRFNLPTNELFSDKKMPEGSIRTRDHLHNQFNRMIAKAQGIEDNSDDGDFHFDMSLGREKAGGGKGGKRAKMGKLIIFDDGLKMLDLAVAANVGIWWITWERTYDG